MRTYSGLPSNISTMILTFFFNRPNNLIGVRKKRVGSEREGNTIKEQEKMMEREKEKGHAR